MSIKYEFKNTITNVASLVSVVKNLPASAGDMGSISDLRRSHVAAEQLSLCFTTTEPVLRAQESQLPSHGPSSLCSSTREASAMRSPRTTTREKPASNKDPAQP